MMNETNRDFGEKLKNRTYASNVSATQPGTTFLQTAKATVTDSHEFRSKKVRLLFDRGPQKSFVKREVSDALNLPVIRKEKIIVRGFAQAEEVLRSLDVVRLKVWNISRENYREVELYVVPFICNPLCNQSIDLAKATYDHFISLPFTDCTDGLHQLEIDLLIAADYYWRFVSGRMVKGSNEPVALETMLGWVLCGAMKEEKEENSVNVVIRHVLK